MTPAPAETLTLLPESTPVLRFVYTSDHLGIRRMREIANIHVTDVAIFNQALRFFVFDYLQ